MTDQQLIAQLLGINLYYYGPCPHCGMDNRP